MPPLTPQQQAVLDWAATPTHRHANVTAVAGSGKTTTLVALVRDIAKREPNTRIAFLAFNKSVAAEIASRVSGLSQVTASTFHALGMRLLGRALPTLRVEERKVAQWLDQQPGAVAMDVREFVLRTVSIAKQRLLDAADKPTWVNMVQHYALDECLEVPTDAKVSYALDIALDALRASQQLTESGVIDFDDMLYEVVRRGLRGVQFHWVLVDEAQDTNPARRELARMLLAEGGRLVSVGDPYQAIYGFTGADNDALAQLTRALSSTELPLTVSFRCPQRVVEEAQRYVPHIQSAPGAPVGLVERTTFPAFLRDISRPHDPPLGPTRAILCRYTRPLVSLAFTLLSAGVGCRIEGRDVASSLKTLARRWKRVRSVSALRRQLAAYEEQEVQRLERAGRTQQAQAVRDRVGTLCAVCDGLPDDAPVAEVSARLDALFGDTQPGEVPKVVTLSTVHKAKGREWPTVYLLGENVYMPSPYATQAWEQEQERNLLYVAITRAQQALVYVDLE
jgi:superfamily I DNA/RNA helicase